MNWLTWRRCVFNYCQHAADITDRKVATSAEDNRQETQQAILQELLATLKEEANRLDDDVWMYEFPRCTYR